MRGSIPTRAVQTRWLPHNKPALLSHRSLSMNTERQTHIRQGPTWWSIQNWTRKNAYNQKLSLNIELFGDFTPKRTSGNYLRQCLAIVNEVNPGSPNRLSSLPSPCIIIGEVLVEHLQVGIPRALRAISMSASLSLPRRSHSISTILFTPRQRWRYSARVVRRSKKWNTWRFLLTSQARIQTWSLVGLEGKRRGDLMAPTDRLINAKSRKGSLSSDWYFGT